MKKIEDEIIEFLIKSPLFLGQDPIFSTIKAYFITRKDLTQNMLKQLTGFSAGTISQEINKMINKYIIQKTGKTESGQILYTMESIELAFLAAFLHLYEDLLHWGEVFQQIKSEMDEEKENLDKLNGYQTIYRMISMIQNSIALYDQLLKVIEEEKVALENQKG